MKAWIICFYGISLCASHESSFSELLRTGAYEQALMAIKKDNIILRKSGLSWLLQHELPRATLPAQINFISHICTWPLDEGDELLLLLFVGKREPVILHEYLKFPQKRYYIAHLDKKFFERHVSLFSADAYQVLQKHQMITAC